MGRFHEQIRQWQTSVEDKCSEAVIRSDCDEYMLGLQSHVEDVFRRYRRPAKNRNEQKLGYKMDEKMH